MKKEMTSQEKRSCEENGMLLAWVLEAVAEARKETELVWVDERFPRNMLLTLLVYSYSREIWTTEEIEQRSRTDATLRYICRNRTPDAEVIKHFRRGHREILGECLASVFRKMFTHPDATSPNSTWLLERAAQDLAEHRIQQAVLMEMIEADI